MRHDNQILERKLRGIWQRQRRLLHSRAACYMVLSIIGLIVFDLAVDWLLELPGWARLLLVCLNLAVVAGVCYRLWWRYLRGYDPLRASLAAERLHPQLNSLLVSYVQLVPGQNGAAEASPRMAEALRQQAITSTGPLDFRGVVDFRTIAKLAVAAAAVLLFFGVSTLFAGPFYRVLAIRMTNPASELGYPTRTRIESLTGDITIRQGDPVALELVVEPESEIPEEAILEIRFGDGPWERVRIASDEPGKYRYSIARSADSFVYRYRAGDARTRYFEANVVPAPQIAESLVRIKYPAYTQLAPQEISSLNFEALEGATIEWQVRCDRALSGANMMCEPGESIEMRIDPNDRHTARATLPAAESLAYQFRWIEKEHGYEYEDPVRYSLRVAQDEPPLVEILPPKPAEIATLEKSLDIHFRAGDEFGLAEAWIVYSVNGGEEHEHALGTLTGKQEDRNIEWKPRDWISNLTESDALTYSIHATDNRAGRRGPNIGRSKPLKLQFVTREDYLKSVAEARDELFSRIKGIQEDEVESSNALKTLKPAVKQ